MKAEIVSCGDNGRVIVSAIKPPVGGRTVCLEFHRGESGKFAVSSMLLTREEAAEVSRAIATIAVSTIADEGERARAAQSAAGWLREGR